MIDLDNDPTTQFEDALAAMFDAHGYDPTPEGVQALLLAMLLEHEPSFAVKRKDGQRLSIRDYPNSTKLALMKSFLASNPKATQKSAALHVADGDERAAKSLEAGYSVYKKAPFLKAERVKRSLADALARLVAKMGESELPPSPVEKFTSNLARQSRVVRL